MAAPSLGWLGEGRMYHTRRALSLRGHAGTLCEVVRTQSAALRIYVKETVSRFGLLGVHVAASGARVPTRQQREKGCETVPRVKLRQNRLCWCSRGSAISTELVASFHACPHGSPRPSWRPRAVTGCVAVRQKRGTPRQRGGWHTHDH